MRFLEELQCRIQQAGCGSTLGHNFRAEHACFVQLEFVKIDIGRVIRMQNPPVNDVVVAGISILAN